MRLRRLLAGGAALWLAGVAVSALSAEAKHGATALTCTNVASGASRQIKIDYDKSTVDSNPARISDGTIAWHSAQNSGNYTLDRKSGDLKVVVASSTGGYFLYHHCELEN